MPLSSGFCVFRYSVTAISKSNVYTSKNWRGFRGVRLFIHSLEFSSFVVSFAFQSRKPPGGGSVVLGGGWGQFVVNWNSCVVCVFNCFTQRISRICNHGWGFSRGEHAIFGGKHGFNIHVKCIV